MLGFLIVVILAGAVYYLFFSPKSQLFGKFLFRVKTSQNAVALTFDDGPNEPFTSQIMQVLEQHGAKGTFFQVGQNIEHSPETTKRLAEKGHEIGLHSFSHSFSQLFTGRNLELEIDRAQRKVTELTGEPAKYYRPPWLFRHPKLFKILRNRGLTPISGLFINNWEIFQPSAKKMARSALKKVKPGTILIFHDGYNSKGAPRDQTVAALDLIIRELQHKQNYRFVTVSELLSL